MGKYIIVLKIFFHPANNSTDIKYWQSTKRLEVWTPNPRIPKLKDFLFQIFQVAPSLHMVELRKAGGDTLEFQKVWIDTLAHLHT